jgi:hypothetical protein
MFYYKIHDDDTFKIDTDRSVEHIKNQLQDLADDFEVCIRCKHKQKGDDLKDSLLEEIVGILQSTSPYKDMDNGDEMLKMPVEEKNIYEDDECILIAYYVPLSDYLGICTELDKDTVEEHRGIINNIGTSIVDTEAISDVVLVKHDMSYVINREERNVKYSLEPVSLSENNLKYYLLSVYVHEGLMIDADGTLNTYTYTHDIFDAIMNEDAEYADKYRYHEYGIFNHKLHIIVNTQEQQIESNFNEMASVLCGKTVYGRVHCALTRQGDYGEFEPYANLNRNRIDAIYKLKMNFYNFNVTADTSYVHFDTKLNVCCSTLETNNTKTDLCYDSDVINNDV